MQKQCGFSGRALRIINFETLHAYRETSYIRLLCGRINIDTMYDQPLFWKTNCRFIIFVIFSVIYCLYLCLINDSLYVTGLELENQ